MESSIFGRSSTDVGRLTELRKQLPMLFIIFKLSIISLINFLIKLDNKLKTNLFTKFLINFLIKFDNKFKTNLTNVTHN